MMIQKATVKKVTSVRETWKGDKLIQQEYEEKVVHTSTSLEEAYAWTKEYQNLLWPGEHYDIYYRCECI